MKFGFGPQATQGVVRTSQHEVWIWATQSFVRTSPHEVWIRATQSFVRTSPLEVWIRATQSLVHSSPHEVWIRATQSFVRTSQHEVWIRATQSFVRTSPHEVWIRWLPWAGLKCGFGPTVYSSTHEVWIRIQASPFPHFQQGTVEQSNCGFGSYPHETVEFAEGRGPCPGRPWKDVISTVPQNTCGWVGDLVFQDLHRCQKA